MQWWLGVALLCIVALDSQVDQVTGSPFNPRPLKPHGNAPYFEGWYARVTDTTNSSVRAAVIFASYQPPGQPSTNLSFTETYAALILRLGNDSTVAKELLVHDAPSITVNGHPVTTDPAHTSPSHFLWESAHFGSLLIDDGQARVNFHFGGVTFQANMSSRLPWDWQRPDGPGPEGLIPDRILPLHYYVQSLSSPCTYGVQVGDTTVAQGTGLAHLEANWGQTFPEGWTWAEGIGEGFSFVLTGGLFTFGPVTTKESVVAVRHSAVNVTMRSTDLIDYELTVTPDACAGILSVTGHHRLTRYPALTLHMHANLSTFAQKLYIPKDTGFTTDPGCIESFTAHVEISIERSPGEFTRASFDGAALEFGGIYQCPPF